MTAQAGSLTVLNEVFQEMSLPLHGHLAAAIEAAEFLSNGEKRALRSLNHDANNAKHVFIGASTSTSSA